MLQNRNKATNLHEANLLLERMDELVRQPIAANPLWRSSHHDRGGRHVGGDGSDRCAAGRTEASVSDETKIETIAKYGKSDF